MEATSTVHALVTDLARVFVRRNWLVLALTLLAFGCSAGLAIARVREAGLVLSALAIYAPLLLGFVTMSGIVSEERQSGFIVMWYQKPQLISRAYAIRFGLLLVLLTCVIGLLAGLVVVLAALTEVIPVRNAVRFACAMFPLAWVPAVMTFACSAWGARRDAMATFMLIVVGVSLAALKATQADLPARLIKVLSFPISSIMSIIGAHGYGSDLFRPVSILVTQLVFWSLLGWIGLRRLERTLRL